MKVRMTESLTGSLDGRRYPPRGEEFDVPDVVGVKLCEKGYAEPIAQPAKPEKAAPRAAEKRAAKKG